MEKELEKKLRKIQANPTTGTAHNENLVSAQIEQIFALDILTKEVVTLEKKLGTYNEASKKQNKAIRYLTVALGAVAILQLFIAYGQFKLGEVQIETSQDQRGLQNAIWLYEKNRNDRIEMRDVNWRREDLQFEGRLP